MPRIMQGTNDARHIDSANAPTRNHEADVGTRVRFRVPASAGTPVAA